MGPKNLFLKKQIHLKFLFNPNHKCIVTILYFLGFKSEKIVENSQFLSIFRPVKMKFLIVACLLAAVAAQDFTEDEKITCADEYLGGGNLTEKCDGIIKHLRDQYVGIEIMLMHPDAAPEWAGKCIMDYVAKYKYFDFFLQADLEYGHQKPTVELQMEVISIRSAPISLCKRSHGFDGLFEQFLEESKSNRGEEKYMCMYKWGIEKKIIEKSDFDFETSSSVDCTKFFTLFDEQFARTDFVVGKTATKFKTCEDRKNAEYFMLRDVEVFRSVAMFDLTETQKEKFKAMFWLWFSGGDRIIMECVRDAYKKV